MTPADLFASAQQWLFEALIEPVAFQLGLGNLLEDGFVAAGWLLMGLLQIAVLLLVIGPLQRLWPVEPVRDRAAIRVDVLYTLLHRLGLFKLAMFFSVEAWLTDAIGLLRALGLPTLHLDQLWPGVSDGPLASFVLYLLVFDLLGYLLHRAQHQWEWWWRLHAVHHSQRQMTMWSDDRNHLLDSAITDAIVVLVAILIGVAPSQFVLLVALTQLLESLQHANLRWSFGRLGERLLVSPRFHRRHHAIGIGHEAGAQGALKGVNFGVLFPFWDALLGSADFGGRFEPTGIRDQVEQGRDYGRGFWAQQWLGLRRLVGRA
ncbi:MAG: sterol desaturase family protein [Proteobacteria bacterium]|nr:sterol desaturase family protein [Burkholderiales bacterium]MCA0310470.1 sterol desaturase family protein [Pseudomonadota bacterium]